MFGKKSASNSQRLTTENINSNDSAGVCIGVQVITGLVRHMHSHENTTLAWWTAEHCSGILHCSGGLDSQLHIA